MVFLKHQLKTGRHICQAKTAQWPATESHRKNGHFWTSLTGAEKCGVGINVSLLVPPPPASTDLVILLLGSALTCYPSPGNFFFFFFCFLGPCLRHMEVSRLGIKSELQLTAYATATAMQDPSLICDSRQLLVNKWESSFAIRSHHSMHYYWHWKVSSEEAKECGIGIHLTKRMPGEHIQYKCCKASFPKRVSWF